MPHEKGQTGPVGSMAGSAVSRLSPEARAYHDEYWMWLWHGPEEDKMRTIGSKKIELRNKYGPRAEEDLIAALREDGFLPNKVDMTTCR